MRRSFGELDKAATLQVAAGSVRRRRDVEVEELETAAHWADLHSNDPQAEPGAIPVRFGGDKLIRPGGEGTPKVQELCLLELGIALECSEAKARSTVAAALDLRHRLPDFWRRVQHLEVEPWIARKITRMTRTLTPDQVGEIDALVTEHALESPARLIRLVETAVIALDAEAERARQDQARRRRGVWLLQPRPGEDEDDQLAGLRTIVARASAPDAIWFDATIDQIADLLAHRHPDPRYAEMSRDELRAEALGWLARPQQLATLINNLTSNTTGDTTSDTTGDDDTSEHAEAVPADHAEDVPHGRTNQPGTPAGDDLSDQPDDMPDEQADEQPDDMPDEQADEQPDDMPDGQADSSAPLTALSQLPRPNATIYVHIGQGPVADVEDLGPLLLERLADLLGHTRITLTPVIDLHVGRAINSYTHPADVRERCLLRTGGDRFPHSTGSTRNIDLDHPIPYDPNGPPSQTGDHNALPLTRRHHRAKTHLGYQVKPLGPDRWLWTTPHGLCRVVTLTGTQPIGRAEAYLHTLIDASGPLSTSEQPDPNPLAD